MPLQSGPRWRSSRAWRSAVPRRGSAPPAGSNTQKKPHMRCTPKRTASSLCAAAPVNRRRQPVAKLHRTAQRACYDRRFGESYRRMLDRLRASWPAALILAGMLACAGGLVVHRMDLVLPWARFGDSLVLAALSIALAWPIRRVLNTSWAHALGIVWLIALIVFCGVLPI